MKINLNIKKSFLAPFKTDAAEGIYKIYIIATGFTIAVWLIHLIFTFLGFAGTVLICLIHLIHFIISLATQSYQFGYLIETVKLEVEGSSAIMPGWENNYARFFKNGLKLQLIAMIYLSIIGIVSLIIPIICGICIPIDLSSISIETIKQGELAQPLYILLLCSLTFVVPIILLIIFVFIYPMILVHFATEGRMLAAFNLVVIFKKIFLHFIDYILAILLVLISLIPFIILCLLLCITIVGWVGIALLQFIYLIVVFNLFAQVYIKHKNAT